MPFRVATTAACVRGEESPAALCASLIAVNSSSMVRTRRPESARAAMKAPTVAEFRREGLQALVDAPAGERWPQASR